MDSINYVKSPKTNRPVKVGSRVWRDFVKEGALSAENFVDEKELYELKPEDDPDQVIEELDKELPHNVQAVRGRGKYQGKIIKRDKPYDNLEQTVDVVKKATVQAVKQLPEVTSDNEEDWESALESISCKN